MTEKTLASPKPSEIPIANNFKKVFRQGDAANLLI